MEILFETTSLNQIKWLDLSFLEDSIYEHRVNDHLFILLLSVKITYILGIYFLIFTTFNTSTTRQGH